MRSTIYNWKPVLFSSKPSPEKTKVLAEKGLKLTVGRGSGGQRNKGEREN